MENKINIAELLKDCPKGMELDCLVFEDVTLYKIDTDIENEFPIRIKTKNDYFLDLTKYGTYSNVEEAKCVIFPKGKTTWDGFQRPFKDGDIIFSQYYDLKYIAIVKTIDNSNDIRVHCLYGYTDAVFATNEILGRLEESLETRLATEEEKHKLFQAIKDNGYKWNDETKTLEKLIESKFKIGNWYQCTKDFFGKGVTFDKNTAYYCAKEGCLQNEYGCHIAIIKDLYDNFKLWTIQDAKDGDVLAAHECLVLFKKLGGFNIKCYCTYHFMNNPSFYVDTLQNKTAFHPATEEERRKLFEAIKANGYYWNAETKTLEKFAEPKFEVWYKIKNIKTGNIYEIIKIVPNYYIAKYLGSDIMISFNNQDEYELVSDKFDITTLKEFDSRVLVRMDNCDLWRPALFGFVDKSSGVFYVLGGNSYSQCIPYDRNEHLRGTTNDCDDFYKTWE